MSRDEHRRDLARDPWIEAALRRLDDSLPWSEARWQSFERRIRHAARASVQHRRIGRVWWEETARWAGAVVPVGMAAGLVAAVLLATAQLPDRAPGRTSAVTNLVLAVTIAETAGDLVDATVGPLDAEWMHRMVIR